MTKKGKAKKKRAVPMTTVRRLCVDRHDGKKGSKWVEKYAGPEATAFKRYRAMCQVLQAGGVRLVDPETGDAIKWYSAPGFNAAQ